MFSFSGGQGQFEDAMSAKKTGALSLRVSAENQVRQKRERVCVRERASERETDKDFELSTNDHRERV